MLNKQLPLLASERPPDDVYPDKKTPKRLKFYSHPNYKKGISETLILECLRLWEKEKKKRQELATIQITNYKHNFVVKERHIKSIPQQNATTHATIIPSKVNFSISEANTIPSVQLQRDPELSSLSQTKNVFRVKLNPHPSRNRSMPWKNSQDDNVSELNINLKAISNRSVFKEKKKSLQRKRDEFFHSFYQVKLRKQHQAIKVDSELLESDFVLSPW